MTMLQTVAVISVGVGLVLIAVSFMRKTRKELVTEDSSEKQKTQNMGGEIQSTAIKEHPLALLEEGESWPPNPEDYFKNLKGNLELDPLNETEEIVLCLICKNKRNLEIVTILPVLKNRNKGYSPKYIDQVVASIYGKLGLTDDLKQRERIKIIADELNLC